MVRYVEPIGHDTGLVCHVEARTVDSHPTVVAAALSFDAVHILLRPCQLPFQSKVMHEDIGPRAGDPRPWLMRLPWAHMV